MKRFLSFLLLSSLFHVANAGKGDENKLQPRLVIGIVVDQMRYDYLYRFYDQYSENGFLVWYPKEKCLASADYEHEKFKILDKWEDFIKCPSHTINKIFC